MKINLNIDPDKESKQYIRKFVERKALVITYTKKQADDVINLLYKLGYQWEDQRGNNSGMKDEKIGLFGFNKSNYKNGGVPTLGLTIAGMYGTVIEIPTRQIILQPTFFLENFEKYYKDEN